MSIVVSSEFLDDPGCPGRGVGGSESLPAGRRSSGIGGGRMKLVGGERLSGFRKSILHGRKRSSTDAMRRLSGLEGGGDGVYDGDGADHKKLAEMYSEIIKLSSQNKINAKNSWSLDLINHMDRMILGGNGAGLLRGRVNFQKASCTLDASIKIYSYRVDETIASTYRVLENLSRTDASGDLMEDGEHDGNAEVGVSMGRRRAVQRGGGGGVVDTVEKNASNINISSLDAEFDVDPMFRKMSKLFNESGPKGMLLLNLPVRNGCCVAFDSCKTVKHAESSERSPDNDDRSTTTNSSHQQVQNSCPPPMIDVSLLRMKLQELLDSSPLSSLPLVPQFSLFREELLHLGEAEAEAAVASNVGLATQEEELGSVYGQDKNSVSLKPATPLYDDCGMEAYDSWCSDERDGDNGNFLHMVEEGEEQNSGSRGMTQGSALEETRLMLSHVRSGTGFTAGDGYSFFDPSMARLLAAGKRSAGMDHWKFAVQLSIQTKGKTPTLMRKKHENEDPQGGDNYTSTRQDRKPFCIDFDAPYVESTAFAPPPSRSTCGRRSRAVIAPSNATQLTAQYIARTEAAVARGKDPHVLSKDLHFKPEDLTKLFLRPGFVTKCGTVQNGTGSIGEGDGSFDDVDHESHGPMETIADNEFDMSEAQDGFFLGRNVSDQGMFDRNGLLQVPRRAQKLEVSCSRKEKRVDVRKLKKDLWQHIDTTMCTATSESTLTAGECPPEGEDKSEKLPPLATGTTRDVQSQPEALAFSAMLGDVSLKEEQAGVTVPYYFLCLLHLANEKGLRLEGSGDLHGDFFIYPSATTC
eukprot:295252_1